MVEDKFIYIRSQHGIKFHDLPSVDCHINRGYDEFKIKYHKTFIEILYTFYERKYTPNHILFLIISPIPLNPDRIVQLLDRVLQMGWGDDFLYVKMTLTGRIVDWLKIRCPAFYLEHVDPRYEKEKIVKDCDILIRCKDGEYRYFYQLLNDYIDFDEHVEEIERVVSLVREMGDDLLRMVYTYDIRKILDSYGSYRFLISDDKLTYLKYLLDTI